VILIIIIIIMMMMMVMMMSILTSAILYFLLFLFIYSSLFISFSFLHYLTIHHIDMDLQVVPLVLGVPWGSNQVD
jgi:hypothetical protein